MNETDARTRILAEATRLFAHRGYGATSVREVVDAAGVTKPTLYYWFQSKEGLFLEAVNCQLALLGEIVGDTLAGSGPLEDRLLSFVERYVGTALDNPDGCRLLMTVQHPNQAGQPEVDLLSMHVQSLDALIDLLEGERAAGLLRPDADVPVAALSLVGTANMHIVAALHGMPLPVDTPSRIVRNFMHGVAPP